MWPSHHALLRKKHPLHPSPSMGWKFWPLHVIPSHGSLHHPMSLTCMDLKPYSRQSRQSPNHHYTNMYKGVKMHCVISHGCCLLSTNSPHLSCKLQLSNIFPSYYHTLNYYLPMAISDFLLYKLKHSIHSYHFL
jgi:hypothetical protein